MSNHQQRSDDVLVDLRQVSERLTELTAAAREAGEGVGKIAIEELEGLIVHARKLAKAADAERLHKKYEAQQVVDATNSAYNPLIKMAKEASKAAEAVKLAYDARVIAQQRAAALEAAAKLAAENPDIDKSAIETAALAGVVAHDTAHTEHGSLQTQTRRRPKITDLRKFVESQMDAEWLATAAQAEAARMMRSGEQSPFVEIEIYEITIAR